MSSLDIIVECMNELQDVKQRFESQDIQYKVKKNRLNMFKTRRPTKFREKVKSVNYEKIVPVLDKKNYFTTMRVEKLPEMEQPNNFWLDKEKQSLIDRKTLRQFRSCHNLSQKAIQNRNEYLETLINEEQSMTNQSHMYLTKNSSSKILQQTELNSRINKQQTRYSISNINTNNTILNSSITSKPPLPEESKKTFRIQNISNFKLEPLKKYDAQIIEDSEIEAFVQNRITQNLTVQGYSRFKDPFEQISWVPCEVIGFNSRTQEYEVRFFNGNKIKWVTRSNLVFMGENMEEYMKRFNEADSLRREQLMNLSLNGDLYIYFYNLLVNVAQLAETVQLSMSEKVNKGIINRTFTKEFIQYKDQTLPKVMEESLKHYRFYVLRFITAFQQDSNLTKYFKKFLPYEYEKKLEIKPPQEKLIQIEFTEEHIKYYQYESMKGYFNNNLKQLHEKYMGTALISDLKDRPRVLYSIVKIFDALQNVKDFHLFHGYTQIANLGQVDANNIHEICTREFKTTQEKIEILIYRAEKSIEKLGLEILVSYQKQMEKTLNRDRISYTQYRDNYLSGLAKNANIILTSCLQFSIEESFEEIIKFHFKYFLTLPVPNITQEDLKVLPHQLVVSLYKARDIFMLNDDLMFCQTGTFNTLTKFEQQQQILYFSFCSIIKQCLEGRKSSLENPPIAILGLHPVISIKLSTFKHKKHHTPYNIFKYLIIQRQKIYECESHRKKIIFDLYKINSSDYPTDYDDYLKLIQNKNVTMGVLGWFNFKNLRIAISPKLDQVETQLKTAFDLFIHNICNIEEIYGYKNNKKVNLYAISQYEVQFRQQFDYFLEHSFLGAMALTWMFNQFDFYLQDKNYIDAFLQIFEGSNNTKILNEERLCLLKDLDFIQNLQPDSYCIGLFRIDVKEVKQTLIAAIEKNIQIIDDAFKQRIEKLLNETEEQVLQVQSKLSKQLTTIQNYIEQVQFMKEKQIERMQQKIRFNLGVCQNLINSIERFQIPLNPDVYDNFLSSVRWEKIIEEDINKAKDILSNLAPEFQNMVNQDNQLIIGTFEIIQHDITKFQKEYDLSRVQDHLLTAKHLEDQLLEIEHRTNALNEQIKYLRLPSIDTSFVTDEIKSFSYYVNFWEIAEKIKYHSDTWLKGPFMTSDIEEITEVCRDGTHIINSLRKSTQQTLNSCPDIKIKFHESLKSLEQSIDVFNKNLNLFIILKDRNFKENQWNEFIDIMFKNKPQPDLTKLSMYDLMQENIQNYQSDIIEISNLAKRNTYLDNQFSQLDSQIKDFAFKFVSLEDYGYKNLQRIRAYKQSKMTLKEIMFECWQLGSKEIQQALKQKLLIQEVALKACKKIMTYKIRLQGHLLQILPIMDFTSPQERSYLQQHRDELMKFYEQIKKSNLSFFSQYVNNDPINPNFDKSYSNELNRTIESIQYLQKILTTFHKKWENLMEVFPRLYMINEHQLANLFKDSFLKAGAIRLFLRLYPNIKNTDLNIKDNQIKINLISNHYNEDFFAVKEISYPIIEYTQDHQLQLGLINCATQMEEQYKATLKRNIFIHLGKLGSMNYDFNKIWKFIQIRQMYFQSVSVCLDIQFAHDLTIMLLNHHDRTTRRILEDFQNYLMTNLNQFKANQIESNKKLFSVGLFHIYNQLILKVIYYRDIIDRFLQFYEISQIEQTPYRLNSFEYMALPKFTLEYDTKTALDNNTDERLQNLPDTHTQYQSTHFFKLMNNPVEFYKNQLISYNNVLHQTSVKFPHIPTQINDNFNSACSISLVCLTAKLNYGYDIMDFTPLFVSIPQSDRNLLWMIQTLSASQALVLKNGTSTQFKQLAANLGKTYYEYDAAFISTFSAVYSIVQGLSMGDFFVHVRNSELMDPLCFINFNNQISDIKQNLILSNQFKDSYFNLCFCFNHEFNFNSIINQNFRVINLIRGEEAIIIRHLLFVLGLEEKSDEVAKGLLYIFGFIQEQFFYHLQQQVEKLQLLYIQTHNSANSTIPIDQLTKYLGTTQIIKLIHQSIQKMRVAYDQENELDPFDTIRYNLDQYFKNLLNTEMYEIYTNIQQLVLPQHTTLKYLEQQEDKKKYDYIKECHEELKSSMTVSLAVIAYNFSLALERKEVITLVGNSFYEQEQILAYGSFIKSRYINGVFLLHYFPLFAMNENLKFGTNEKHSIFQELIRYLNGEQLNFFEIYSKPSRQSEIPKAQITPSTNDWMILQFHEIGPMEENIISQCNDHNIILKSDIVKFPISIRQIILLDNLCNLSPKTISAMNIINVNSELFNFNQEFEQWLTNKTTLQSSFYERFKLHLQLNFLHFFEDICSYIFLEHLRYNITKRTIYFQLLKMIDILLNEIRKKEIAHGFTGYKDLTLEEKKIFSFDPNQLQNNSEIKELFSSKDLMVKRDKTLSESIFILALLLGPLSLFDKFKQIKVSTYLKKKINELMALQFGKCENYAYDVIQIVDENNIFNYNFDIKQEKWIEWDEFEFDFTEYKYFQSSLNSNIISATELVRLNPSGKDLTQVQNQIAIEMHFQKPSQDVQQHIKSQTKLLYTINLQLLYQKQIILIGAPRTGKTQLLQNFINQYNQIENMKPVYYSVIENKTKILSRLLDQCSNIGSTLSNRKKCISLFIDDVHLSQQTELLMNSLGQYNGYYSERQGQFVSLIRFNSLIVSQRIQSISENAFFNRLEKIEISELESIYSSQAQKFVLNVLHYSIHQNEQVQNLLQSPLLTAIFNNPYIIEYMEDNMNLINLLQSLKIFFPCDDFPQLSHFKEEIQKLIDTSTELDGDLYHQMAKMYTKWIDSLINNTAISTHVDKKINQTFVTLVSIFANMNGIKSPRIETNPEEFLNFFQNLKKKVSQKKTLDRISLKVVSLSEKTLECYFNQVQAMINMTNNITMCETNNDINIYQFLFQSFQGVQVILREEWQSFDFGKKLRIQIEKTEGVLQLCFMIERTDDFMKLFNLLNLLLWTTFYENTTPFIINSSQYYNEWIRSKLKIIIITDIPIDEPVLKKAKLSGQVVFLRSPKIHEMVSTTSEKFYVSKELVKFSDMILKNPNIVTEIDLDELNLRLSLGSLILKILESELGQKEERIKQETTYNTLKNLISLKLKIFQQAYDISPMGTPSSQIQNDRLLKVQHICHTIEKTVLKSYVQFRLGLNEGGTQYRSIQMYLLAIYISCFCIMNEQQRQDYLFQVAAQEDSLDEYIFWITNVAGISLNGRGEDYLFYRTSYAGNKFLCHNFSFVKFFLEASDSPFLLLIDPNQQTFNQIRQLLFKQSSKAYSTFQHQNYIFDDKEKLVESMKIGGVYVAVSPNQEFQKILKQLAVQWVVALNTKYSTQQQDQGPKVFEIQLEDEYIKAKSSFKLIIITEQEQELNIWDKNLLRTLILINFTTNNPDQFVHSLGDIILNNLYSNQKRNIMSHYLKSVEQQIKLQESPYIRLIEQLETLDYGSDETINDLSHMKFSKFSYQFQDLLEEQLNLQINLSKQYETDPDILRQQKQLYKRVGKEGIGQNLIQIIKETKTMHQENDAVSDSFDEDDDSNDEKSESEEEKPKKIQSQKEMENENSSEDSDEDLDDFMEDEGKHDANVYLFTRTLGVEPIEHIFIIPKLQKLINPFMPYLDFICFLWESYQIFKQKFGSYFITDLFFQNLLTRTCGELVEGKLADRNETYKFKESNCLEAMKSTFQYIGNALGKTYFNLYLILMCKQYLITYNKHNEYLWQLVLTGGCEKLLPEYLIPLSKDWQTMEGCNFNQEKNPLFEIEDRYQSALEFDYEYGGIQESEFLSEREKEKKHNLLDRHKAEKQGKNMTDQLINKWQDKRSKRISTKNDTRKRQSLVRQNILPLDIIKIMEENQVQKSDSQSESGSENDLDSPQQIKRTTRGSGRLAFSVPTNGSLIGKLTANIQRGSVQHKEKLFNLKVKKNLNEVETIALHSELRLPEIIKIKDENLQSLKLLRKNINQFFLNLLKNLLTDHNLRMAINSILLNQSSILDFVFQELTSWPWHDKALFMPASIIQYNLSEYAYAILMKYLRPDEYYRFMPKLFFQSTSEVFQQKLEQINQDHKEQKLNILIIDEINLQNSIQDILEWSYVNIQKRRKHYVFKQNTPSQLLEILTSQNDQLILYNLVNASVEELKVLLENQSASQQYYFVMTEKEFFSNGNFPQYLLQLFQFANIQNLGKVQGIKDLMNIYFKNELDNVEYQQQDTSNSIKSTNERRTSPRKRHSIEGRIVQSNLNISTVSTSPYHVEDYIVPEILKTSIYQQNQLKEYFRTYNITVYSYAFSQFYEFYQRSDLIREDGLENSIQFVQKNKFKFIYNLSLMLYLAKNQFHELSSISDQEIRDFVESLTQILHLFPTNPFIFTLKYLNSFIPIFNHNSHLLDQLLLIFFPTRKGKDIRLEIDGVKLPLFYGENKKETMIVCLNELPNESVPYRLFDIPINKIHLKNVTKSQKTNQQLIELEQEDQQKSLYQKQKEILMEDQLKKIQKNILMQFKSELFYLLNFILDSPISEEELAVGFQSNEDLQVFLKKYDEQFSLSNIEPLKSLDSSPDVLIKEVKTKKLQSTIKSRVMTNIAALKTKTQFKITGKTFAKTLHQMSIKSRNYLQGLQKRASGIPMIERRPYLVQVLKNSDLIQMILLNEVCTQISQSIAIKTNILSPLQKNMQHLIYLHKSQTLNSMIYKHQTNIRHILDVTSLWDVQGLIICMMFHYALNNKINLMDVKIKVHRMKSKSFLIKQDFKQGIFLKGIRIYNGSLNANNNFLQEERSMEFWSDIGVVQLRPAEQTLSKNQLQMPEVSIEFQDKIHDNLHQEFLDQQSQIVNVLDFEFNQHYFDQEIPQIVETPDVISKKRYMQDRKSDQKLYFVRIPVKTRTKNMLVWWMYLKSHKSQDFWLRQGTYASIDFEE